MQTKPTRLNQAPNIFSGRLTSNSFGDGVSSSNRKFFHLIMIVLMMLSASGALAATVTWTGGGDGVSWGDAQNWSGNGVPGTTDDVAIGTISGNGTISITTTVQVKSLTSAAAINISAGSLTLSAPSSTVALTIDHASLTVIGVGTTFSATGQVTVADATLNAQAGATVLFPTLTTLLRMNLSADVGGKLLFPAAKIYSGDSDAIPPPTHNYAIQASGVGSQIDLSSLANLTGTFGIDIYGNRVSSRQVSITASSGGEVDLAGAITGYTSLSLTDATSVLNVDGVTSAKDTDIRVSEGAMLNFKSLTTLTNVFLDALSGGKLLFPAVRTLLNDSYNGSYITASGTSSKIDMSNLKQMTGIDIGLVGSPFYNLRVNAEENGEVDLGGAIMRTDLYSGSGSGLNLAAVTNINNAFVRYDEFDPFVVPTNWNLTMGDGVYLNGYPNLINKSTLRSVGGTLRIGSPFVNQGVLDVGTGGTILAVNLQVDDPGILKGVPSGNLTVSGDLLGSTRNNQLFAPLNTVTFQYPAYYMSAPYPQNFEAMSQDLGPTSAGLVNNFAYGRLAVGTNSILHLVDQSDNSAGTGAEAVYAMSIVVPTGSTLDLDGFHLYAISAQISGAVLNGAVALIPDTGALSLATPTPGSISSVGELDEWTFFGRRGRMVAIQVNPGAGAWPSPLPPQLQWASVQLLDSGNNVLAVATNTVSGSTLTLTSITLPADGTYRIQIKASPSNSNATGNYVVTAWDATPNIRTLNLGQQSSGSLSNQYGLDQWNFSAVAGQQVQLHLVSFSSPNLAFRLTGPGNYVAFTDLTGDSSLISLPSSGGYTLHVYSLTGDTGAYSFVLKQTSVTTLSSGIPYTGTWAGSGQAQLFTIQVPTTGALSVELTDSNSSHYTQIFVRLGAQPPTREAYNYAATGGNGGSQRILVPSATGGTWNILVYGESIPSPLGTFTLIATATPVALTGVAPGSIAPNAVSTLTLTGAGFNTGSTVRLISANNTIYTATQSTTDLPTQITATFAAGAVPTGTYTVQVRQSDGSSAQIPAAVTVQTGRSAFTASIEVPGQIGYRTATTLYVSYANTGAVPMPAPLLILSAIQRTRQAALLTPIAALRVQGFWTSATLPAGYSNAVQLLASGATPGVLQPGESMRVPVYYSGWQLPWDNTFTPIEFSLSSIQADDATAVNWASRESSLQPAGIPGVAWHTLYSGIAAQLGSTAGGYVQLLDAQAAYLGRLGIRITDVDQLWGFEVAQANNAWPVPTLGSTLDDSLPITGALSLSFSRSFDQSIIGRFRSGPLGLGWSIPWQLTLSVATDGTATVTSGSGARRIYQPDSRYAGRYFSQPGDPSVFTSSGSSYQLTAVNGTISAFNNDGTLNYIQDTNGNRVTAGYGSGRLVSLTASSGQTLTLTYSGAGLISKVTDSAGRVTNYAYDASNIHLMSVTAFNGEVTSYTYNTAGGSASQHAMTSITFPGGTHRYFAYDTQGRLASTSVDGGALPASLSYLAGQVEITDALGNRASFYFDHNGQLAKTVDALGNPTYFAHDSSYNLTSVTNALGASAFFAYNAFGAVTAATDFLGNTTNLTYGGSQNQLSALSDANGHTTLYSYNAAGNLLSATFANGRREFSTYDPQGNAMSFVNAAGEPMQYAHNTAGQLTSAIFANGSIYTYAYDSEGHLVSAVDASGAVTFNYDPVTRYLTGVFYPNGKSLTFGYNSGGRRTQMVDQSGFVTTYNYDVIGRLASLTDSGGTIVTYVYALDGRLSRKTNGNGTYTTWDYDANGNVLHLINYAPNGSVSSRFDDTYNAAGLKISEGTTEGTWTYSYDANGQLIHALFTSNNPGNIPNQDLKYNYDPLGNRTSTVINGITTPYVTNNMNQYVSVGGTPYTYDAKGNLVSDGVTEYTYNQVNELTSAKNATTTNAYVYNALRQRIASNANSQTTQHLMDPVGLGNVVGTYSGSGVLVSRYTYGLGLVSQNAGGEIRYYDFDSLGSTVGLVNNVGSYINRYSYLPFGGSLIATASALNPFEFVGEWGAQNAGGGLSAMGARNYSQARGRFIQVDPIGVLGSGTNLYRYGQNNPITYIDPSGLQSYLEAEFDEFQYFEKGELEGPASGHPLFWTRFSYLAEDASDRAEDYQSEHDKPMTFPMGEGPLDPRSPILVPESACPQIGNPGGPPLICVPDSWYDYHGEPLGRHGSITPGSQVVDAVCTDTSSNTGLNAPAGASNPCRLTIAHQPATPVGSFDPNALYGPSGYGQANYVNVIGRTFAYKITFENDRTATAPAQTVTITQNLDSNLDWPTFRLTGIGFADHDIAIPAGTRYYQATVSMTYNGQTFDVLMEAGIRSATGQVYANFYSLDPETELPPSNVLTGFLPPENGTGRGQGFLTYTISPKATLATGVVIRSVATVVFDSGQPITTNQVNEHNPGLGIDPSKEVPVTTDADPPNSNMGALPPTSSASFGVTWSGTDVGAGVIGYDVYVRVDGSNWTLWQANTTATSATYVGQPSHSYGFYVVARDGSGNVGPAPTNTTQAQIQTSILRRQGGQLTSID